VIPYKSSSCPGEKLRAEVSLKGWGNSSPLEFVFCTSEDLGLILSTAKEKQKKAKKKNEI
jgi:hypothetical protein